MLTKWFSSTRLETRTKESTIYASMRVIKTHGKRNEDFWQSPSFISKQKCEMKVKAALGPLLRWESLADEAAQGRHHRPISITHVY